MEPGLYGTDGTDPEEASGVLEPEDTLDGVPGVRDVLDTGWSPAERPWAVDDWGTTEAEELAGESLDGRLARELPDGLPDDGDGLGDSSDTDGELLDDEVGDARAGRPWTPMAARRTTPTPSCTPATRASTVPRRPPRRPPSTRAGARLTSPAVLAHEVPEGRVGRCSTSTGWAC